MSDMKKNILIIDDDDRNIFALTATLHAKGFTCVSCTDALEGLLLLESPLPIDAVLLDMMMPDMDGYEAIPKMRQISKRKSIPIFAVTAQAMTGDREKCLQAGANDYISKPIDVDKLLHLLSISIHS
ncbi:MAG: response regulator receiver protein [Chitinophagaceae bacterium]|nr:response regulator receiver protein [Chitinophagaceae bacterium]